MFIVYYQLTVFFREYVYPVELSTCNLLATLKLVMQHKSNAYVSLYRSQWGVEHYESW